MNGPLAGIRVCEATGDVAVRYCARLFAAQGAEVVVARSGDDRLIGYGGAAGKAFGAWLDAGKRTGPPKGAFDLVIAGQDGEGLAAGEDLARSLPGKPMVLALSWFHPRGPYSQWTGTDEVIQALVGLAYSFGPAQGPPTLAQGHGPQLAAGVTAFNAAMAAILLPKAERPGRIDLSVHEAAMCFTETGAMSTAVEGGLSVRLGVNRFVPTYPCSSYRSADGWVGVTALTPAQWSALCKLVGRPDLAAEPRFATAYQRLMLGDEVDALLEPVFATRTGDEWAAAGDAHRIPITPMPDLRGLPTVAHWVQRGSFDTFDSSGLVGPTLPFRTTFDGAKASRPTGRRGQPLAGLRVVDFSMGWAGPLCTRTLGDLGAEIIKIESSSHPDWWRGWEADAGGDPPPRETRHNFLAVNRNKLGIDLDLTDPAGLAAAKALVAGADIVVENFAAGVLEKLGLGPAVQRALNPAVISVSMPAFGNGGPLSGLRAYGSTVEQASGLPFANGQDDWRPCLQHVAYGDPLAGLYAAAAVLTALAARDRLGAATIDLAQVACLFEFGADALIAQQLIEGPLPRTGTRRPRAAPVCVVRTRGEDAWLAVAVAGDAAWRGLCAVLGRDGWPEDAALTTVEGRTANAAVLEGAIAEWARDQDALAAAGRLQAHGVPAAPVQPTHALSGDPQLNAGGFWTEMDRRYVGRHRMCAAPFRFDGERPQLRLPAPTLGEHNTQVLNDPRQSASMV